MLMPRLEGGPGLDGVLIWCLTIRRWLDFLKKALKHYDFDTLWPSPWITVPWGRLALLAPPPPPHPSSGQEDKAIGLRDRAVCVSAVTKHASPMSCSMGERLETTMQTTARPAQPTAPLPCSWVSLRGGTTVKAFS